MSDRYKWYIGFAKTVKGLPQKFILRKVNVEDGIVYESKSNYKYGEALVIMKYNHDIPLKRSKMSMDMAIEEDCKVSEVYFERSIERCQEQN